MSMANFETGIEAQIENSKRTGLKPRLLLHTCCGPCLAGVLGNVAQYFDVTIYFFNPNILPHEEYLKRLEAMKVVAAHFNVDKTIVPEYDERQFLDKVKGYESFPEGGARCALCFELRLESAAQYLLSHADSYDFFATTLTVSPHKNAELINKIGFDIAARYGVNYLSSNFKKKDGFLISTRLSKELGIYRQNYCGCGMGCM